MQAVSGDRRGAVDVKWGWGRGAESVEKCVKG